MRTTRPLEVLVALVATSLLAGPASASSVSLIWTGANGFVIGLGTSRVEVGFDPVTLTLDVQVEADSAGFRSGELDFEFDVDRYDELNLWEFAELSWTNATGNRSLQPQTEGIVSTQESTHSREGQVFGFEVLSSGTGPVNTTLTFARMVFIVPPRPSNDGADIFNTDERVPGGLGLFTNDGSEFSGGPGALTAEVGFIPEPGTLGLVGLGLAALALAARRTG